MKASKSTYMNKRACSYKSISSEGGFTLVEIIVSFVILALVGTALATAIVAMGNIEQRNAQVQQDNATVESMIASGEEPTGISEELSLPLGNNNTLDSTSDTYSSGLGEYSVLAPSEDEMIPGGMIADGSSGGQVVEYIIPRTGWYRLQVWGAKGGNSEQSNNYGQNRIGVGGNGGYSSGLVKLTEGEIIYLYAGGLGTSGVPGKGGFNAGPDDTYGNGSNTSEGSGRKTGGGGGASDIRIGSSSLYARVIVAGGGGGAGSYTWGSEGDGKDTGGAGGGSEGKPGTTGTPGGGGRQTAGGEKGSRDKSLTASGFGEAGSNNKIGSLWLTYPGGGGGGGWYGGGAGYDDGGGGGSGWIYTKDTFLIWKNGSNEGKNEYLPEGYILHAATDDSKSSDRFGTLVILDGTQQMPDPRSEESGSSEMTGNAKAGYVRVSWWGEDK